MNSDFSVTASERLKFVYDDMNLEYLIKYEIENWLGHMVFSRECPSPQFYKRANEGLSVCVDHLTSGMIHDIVRAKMDHKIDIKESEFRPTSRQFGSM